MDEWKCVKISGAGNAWTLGKIYKTDENGRLIDDDGDVRFTPELYNKLNYTNFKLVLPSIENE